VKRQEALCSARGRDQTSWGVVTRAEMGEVIIEANGLIKEYGSTVAVDGDTFELPLLTNPE